MCDHVMSLGISLLEFYLSLPRLTLLVLEDFISSLGLGSFVFSSLTSWERDFPFRSSICCLVLSSLQLGFSSCFLVHTIYSFSLSHLHIT